MARKRYNEQDILRLLREIEVQLHGCMDVASAFRAAGISIIPIMAGVIGMAA